MMNISGLWQENKKEITYNLINCGIAAALVFFGAFSAIGWSLDKLNWQIVFAAFGAGIVAFVIKFSQYWQDLGNEIKGNKKGSLRSALISFF